jgi:hypothetical protein
VQSNAETHCTAHTSAGYCHKRWLIDTFFSSTGSNCEFQPLYCWHVPCYPLAHMLSELIHE